MEMSQFGKSSVLIMLLLAMASYQPTTSAMVLPVDLKEDMYPDVSAEDYCRYSRDNRVDKRNTELIHNLDRIRGIMNLG